jgi:hypothetical protein
MFNVGLLFFSAKHARSLLFSIVYRIMKKHTMAPHAGMKVSNATTISPFAGLFAQRF